MAERALPGRNELRWWPAMPSDVPGSGVLEFAANAAHARAAHYRDRAARLREMAEAEPIGRLRERATAGAPQSRDRTGRDERARPTVGVA